MYLVRTGADGGQVCIAFVVVVVVVVVKFIVVKVVVITTIADHLRYFTRQLFRQFRSDQFISKLSIIVEPCILANLNNTMQTKQKKSTLFFF